MRYFLEMYKRYLDFSGRSTRREFWCAYGIYIAICLALYIIAVMAGGFSYAGGDLDMSQLTPIGLLCMPTKEIGN